MKWLDRKKNLLKKKYSIPLDLPSDMIIFTGCDKERIDAVIDSQKRVRRMVVHTRTE